MRRIVAVFLSAALLAGCASQGAGLEVTGNDTFVIVRPTGDVAQALPLAEQHCAKYGKVAHFTRMEGFRVVFDCVARGG